MLSLILGIFVSHPASALPNRHGGETRFACETLLDPLSVPTGWGATRETFVTAIQALPEQQKLIEDVAGLVRFAADPKTTPFLDFIGAFAGVSYDESYMTKRAPHVGDLPPASHGRWIMLGDFAAEAVQTGLLARPLSDVEKTVLLEPLGEMHIEPTLSLPVRFQVCRDDVNEFMKTHRAEMPTYADFRLRSEIFSKLIKAQDHQTRMASKLLDDSGRITYLLRAYIAYLQSVVFPPSLNLDENLRSSMGLMMTFERYLRRDVKSDRLRSFLRTYFSEVILKRKTVKRALIQKVLEVRTRELVQVIANFTPAEKSPAPAPAVKSTFIFRSPALPKIESPLPGPTRAERKLIYQSRKIETAEKLSPPSNDTVGAAIENSPSPTDVNVFKNEPLTSQVSALLDPKSPLTEAREKFAALIRADEPFNVTLISGKMYRIVFSEKLIQQLLHPRGGEPEDLREWLSLIYTGRGWKKLAAVVDGRYTWMIKYKRSLHRIYGFRRPDKVWSFDHLRSTL